MAARTPFDDLVQAAGKLIVSESVDPQNKNGPIYSPVDRFAHLPESTRLWLEQLRPNDIVEINEAVLYFRSARVIGKFGRWLVVTIVSTVIAVVMFGEKVATAWSWLTGNRP